MKPIGRLIAVILISFAALAAAHAFSSPAQPQTRVETDQTSGAIRFIVKGQEEARLDSTGLHVRHGIMYGGTITDVGVAGYDYRQTNAGHAR